MCFFRKKIIAPKLNINNKELVITQKLKRKGIKLNTKLVVPRNFAFVLLKNGKVLDCLRQGEYVLSTATLPKAIRKLNLYSNANKLKYIPAEACFVNLNDFDQVVWQTKKIELEDKKYGVFKITASGKFNFRIVDEEKFLEFLLKDVVILSTETASETLLSSINNEAEKIINAKNYSAEMLYFKNSQITKDLFLAMSEHLHSSGIAFDGITLEKVEFPHKTLKQLEKLEAPEVESQGTGTTAFENWQAENPNPEKKGVQFVTIEPAKKGSKNFFKESMAPYFFNNDEADEEPEEVQNPEPKKKNKWIGPIEQEKIEKSKAYVNLDDIDNNN